MYFAYGNHTHAAAEVDLTQLHIARQYSPRNALFFQRHTLVMQGHLRFSTQATIKSAIDELEAAYKCLPGGVNAGQEGHDLDVGLYHDDGTVSSHFLDASEAINGVRLLSLSYPKNDGSEYATGRSYTIVMQADFLNVEDPIYAFQETVQFLGNCERQWELVPVFYGPPEVHVTYEQTPQRIIQSGTKVGIVAHTYPPTELVDAVWKHGEQSFWEYGSPEMTGRHASLLYPCRWRYVFSVPFKMNFYPHME